MLTQGTFRTVSKSGAITIPAKLRREYGIQSGDGYELFVEGKNIILKPYLPRCIFCGKQENVKNYKGKYVCQNCHDAISEALGKEPIAEQQRSVEK
ncbi:AbrB/MazE/SpoVT family DNA-binding domain-containing protein [Vallitalea maricola]|uniref:AbrB/MazE/SpoVT family DNA-binding domain-containing protein n=1 Tax=Vallitalea maricola TaxID=3074433 RepID=A0ACB5UF66_9FIRM|nr:AbrB/MazE/SpoVT family DNA-binding domain-containing protein [Vallitalea sp. AN17-2]